MMACIARFAIVTGDASDFADVIYATLEHSRQGTWRPGSSERRLEHHHRSCRAGLNPRFSPGLNGNDVKEVVRSVAHTIDGG
jgi:hypothetical protein